MNNSKISVKDISIAALLTALALAIPMWMPPIFRISIEPFFSATLAAHVPGILAMFVGPFAVIGTAVGSALGFFSVLGPVVAARAFTHLFFGLLGYKMINKKYNIFLTIIATGILHAAAEMLVALIGLPFVTVPEYGALKFVVFAVGCGTLMHHCIDFVISIIIFKGLNSAKLLNGSINYKSFKA